MTDDNPAYSLIPPPVNVPQAPPVPPIAGVQPAQFKQTSCDASAMSTLGMINKAAQAEGAPIGGTNGATGPGNTPMTEGQGLLNSALSGMGRNAGITMVPGTVGGGGAGSNSTANLVGSLLGKGASLGLDAAGGVKGLASKLGCLLGFGGSSGVDETGDLAQAFNGGDIGSTGLGNVINFDDLGNLTNSVDMTGCLGAAFNGFDAVNGVGDITSGLGGLGDVSDLSDLGCFAWADAAAGIEAGSEAAEAASAAAAAEDAALSIVCTELLRQGRIRRAWHFASSKEFVKFSDTLKRGYYYWSTPCVRHLRKHPNSLFSKFLEKIMNWQAEDTAAKLHFKGAKRRPIAKALIAAVIWPTCFILGKTVARNNPAFTMGGSSATTAS